MRDSPLRNCAVAAAWVATALAVAVPLFAVAGTSESETAAAAAHWAFQPLRRPPVPEAVPGDPSETPLDRFLAASHRGQGFTPAPAAGRRTLARRVYLDLLGIPPAVEEVEDFAGDARPDAWARLVDRLLASPHYGERWGRHWLDVARFADTKDGVLMYGDARMRPFAYTYRDYVIRAFNSGKPFDSFVHEQIAADQLVSAAAAPELAAMGFLTLGRLFDRNRHDIIDDQIDTVTRGFLGLTVSCARCHDHKYDPVATADYYALYGVFNSSEEPLVRPRIGDPGPAGAEVEARLRAAEQELLALRQRHYEEILDTARRETARYLVQVATTEPELAETAQFYLSLDTGDLRPQIVHRWRKLIEKRARAGDPVFAPWHDLIRGSGLRGESWLRDGIDPRVVKALETANPQNPEQVARAYGELLFATVQAAPDEDVSQADPLRELLDGPSSPVWFPLDEVWYYLSRKDKDAYAGKQNELDLVATQAPHAAPRAMSLVDSPEPREPVVFHRGDPSQPGDPVSRRFLTIASAGDPVPFRHGSGRLELAQAITAPGNPLTARVIVNRLWMHHFGAPLVENPNDFGTRTPRPEHQELLDYLATELLRAEWNLKAVHRLILLSSAYQRTSVLPEDPVFAGQHEADPENRWLWRMNRRRLDLEAMRDCLLAVSGELDTALYGRPAPIDDPENRRRTVYATVERQSPAEVVRAFDFPNPDASAGQRTVTTVPQQALFGMNSGFVQSRARALAAATAQDSDPVAALYRRVLLRSGDPEEAQWAADYLRHAAVEELAQVLLLTNEFLFVD